MGVQPSEFWRMRPRHFWYLVSAKEAETKKTQHSKLTGKDAKRLRKMMDQYNLQAQKDRAKNG